MVIEIGSQIPDMKVTTTRGQEITEQYLSDYAEGRPLVLAFYVYDFSPVCTDQMCEINDLEFVGLNDKVRVIGVSSDGPYSHQEFIAQNNISYPLITDTSLKLYNEVGLLDEENGELIPKRGLIVLDSELNIQYSWEAEGNWDPWKVEVMSELNDRVNELL